MTANIFFLTETVKIIDNRETLFGCQRRTPLSVIAVSAMQVTSISYMPLQGKHRCGKVPFRDIVPHGKSLEGSRDKIGRFQHNTFARGIIDRLVDHVQLIAPRYVLFL